MLYDAARRIFNENEKVALKRAVEVLDRYKPSVIITIEKPSWNEKKVYHNGHGHDVSNLVAKSDIFIEEAMDWKLVWQ